jgi:hypothetical protein
MRDRRFGNTLVATLITVAIILVLVVVIFKGSNVLGVHGQQVKARPDGRGTTVLGQVKWSAEDDVCRSNLNQLRQAITLFEQTNDDHPPQNLTETRIGAEFYSCPIGHEPYRYDPSTGQVHCVHPGHDKY